MMGYTHQILYMCEQKTQICSKDDSLYAQTKMNDNKFYMVIEFVTVHLECVSLALRATLEFDDEEGFDSDPALIDKS